MSHLRESEFVDLLDDLLPGRRRQHVDTCAACAEKADALRGTLGRVAAVDVPEPSPLFWDHFSARVRDGVKDATPSGASPYAGWLYGEGLRWAVAGVLVAVLVVAGMWRSGRPLVTEAPAPSIAEKASASSDPSTGIDAHEGLDTTSVDADAGWDLVRAVADEVRWDDGVAASLGAGPGTVDRAVLSLKGEERAELVRLLEAETKRPGA
jgi:hypothetical protein